MAIPDKITTNPEVYAGKWSAKGYEQSENGSFWFDSYNNLSGPNYYSSKNLSQFTNANWIDEKDHSKGKIGKWYTLDLSRKYNTTSSLKQFHLLTFVFRSSKRPNIGRLITASLPEQLAYKIGGKWEAPIKLTGNSTVTALIQTATDNRLSTSFAVDTTQVWMGTEPLEMVFKIPVFDDSGTSSGINYQEALACFGEAILPELNSAGAYSSVPGPNMLDVLGGKQGDKRYWLQNFAEKARDAASKGLSEVFGDELERVWDRITVQVGGLLLMDWCIIKNVKVTFPNTKAMVLHDWSKIESDQRKGQLQPLLAQIEVTVTTAKGITRSNFKNMLQLQEDVIAKDKTTEEIGQELGQAASQGAAMQAWSDFKERFHSGSNFEFSPSGIKSLVDSGRNVFGV